MANQFSLLETILYEPSKGFYLLEQHLTRLQNAITDFSSSNSALFRSPPTNQDIIQKLNDIVPLNDSHHRIRLLVDTSSRITVEHTPLPVPEYSNETLEEAVRMVPSFDVVLDTQPFAASTQDPYVLHKTTQREMYDLSRERTGCEWHGPGPFDVILWNTQGEITETSITNIAIRFIVDDQPIWKTPRVSCGVLPGVFRAFLLKSHPNLVEDIITVEDLKAAQKEGYPIVCFNSVRKAYRVQLLAV